MKNILFVDDESRILDGIRRMLYAERKRWDMEFALGGEAALKAFGTKSFDIVVSDMRMPGMDGAALLTKIREISPITVRIILSGHTEVEAAMRAIPVAHRFLAKPCNASALRDAIEGSCNLQDVLFSPDIRRIVGGIAELPSSHDSIRALTEALGDPRGILEGVAQVISGDMAMSAKVLQLANSAFFGASQTVTTVNGSVAYLGIDTLKNLVFKVRTFRPLEPHPVVPPGFWKQLSNHALRTAAIAAQLPLDKGSLEVAVSAGFLHELGDLIAAAYMPEDFASILANAQERNCQTFEVEEERLGFSHAEIGGYLLGIWGLPQAMVEAIAHHHHPTRFPHIGLDPMIAVYVADLLADELEAKQKSVAWKLTEHDEDCLQELGMVEQFAQWRKTMGLQAFSTGA